MEDTLNMLLDAGADEICSAELRKINASRKRGGRQALRAQHRSRRLTPTLELSWIVDIDITAKPLCGNQQGAEIGYNPQKPGRSAILS